MAAMSVLFIGTLIVVYTASYSEVYERNIDMLNSYVAHYLPEDESQLMGPPNSFAYDTPDQDNGRFGQNRFDGDRTNIGTIPPRFDDDSRRIYDTDNPIFQSTIFYSVAIAYSGTSIEVNNPNPSTYSDSELEAIAEDLIQKYEQSGSIQNSGTDGNWIYAIGDKGSYALVAFIDNTIIEESTSTLFRYTLIFGIAALLVMFFVAQALAKFIVKPVEETYDKQKRFISDAGHELKTPVSIISANADLLSRQLPDNQWLHNIQEENQRMGKLIHQLLDLTKSEYSQLPLTELDFSRLVLGEVLRFETIAFEKGFSLESTIEPNLHVLGNEDELKELLSILLDNAIAYGIPSNAIEVSLKPYEKRAVLAVKNEISEGSISDTKHFFDRFYREDEARTGSSGHYGLGLAIAQAITDHNHGTIGAQVNGQFITFTVHLPLK